LPYYNEYPVRYVTVGVFVIGIVGKTGETVGVGVTAGEVVAVDLAVGVGDVAGVTAQPVSIKTAKRRIISFFIVVEFSLFCRRR